MKEKDIQREFMKAEVPFGAYELKMEKGRALPYDKVAEHQIAGLRMVKSEKGLFYKINDMPAFRGSLTRFANPKPFDCFRLKCEKAYVAICFYKPRQKKEVLCIEVDTFADFKKTADRKSITEEQARSITEFIITV